MAYKRLGDVLIEAGLVTEKQVEYALKIQKESRRRLGEIFIDAGIITETQVAKALQEQLGVEFVDLMQVELDPKLAELVPSNMARQYSVVPVRSTADNIHLAMSDPLNFMAIEAVKTIIVKEVIPLVSTSTSILQAIEALYGKEQEKPSCKEEPKKTPVVTVSEQQEFVPKDQVVRQMNGIFDQAIAEKVYELRIEPRENSAAVRARINGELITVLTISKATQIDMVSYLKHLVGLNISETSVPQEGYGRVQVSGESVELRISTLPTMRGERATINLFDKDESLQGAHGIGLRGENLDRFTKILEYRRGLVLVVGPARSGKSTTLHTMMRHLNNESLDFVSLEDPIEHSIEGITQVQVSTVAGMTFANSLRTTLRQSPDIIAVGDIFDGETAELAMQAAACVQLVLATMTLSEGSSVFTRLIEMGVESRLIARSVRGVISQNLAKRVCPFCHELNTATPEDCTYLGIKPTTKVYNSSGCPECLGTGRKGQVGLFKTFMIDDLHDTEHDEHELVRRLNASLEDRDAHNCAKENAKQLVLEGLLPIEEARKVEMML